MVRLTYARINGRLGMAVKSSKEDYAHVSRAANTRSLEDAIKLRMFTDFDPNNPIWKNDLLTSSFVMYKPGEGPLYLKGFTLPEVIVGNFRQEGDLIVEEELVNELFRYTSVFPLGPVSSQSSFLGDYSQLLGVNGNTLKSYGQYLDHNEVKFVQIVPLKRDYVNSRPDNRPFIRQVRLKGIDSRNHNRGGLIADVSVGRGPQSEAFLRSREVA